MSPSDSNREDLRRRLVRELGARSEIVLAILHGSFERGEAFRDIDVAIWLDPAGHTKDQRFRYALDLAVQLRVSLGYPADVHVLNDAPLAFRYHALAGSPVVVRDETLLDELRARTWDEYFDFLPLARHYLREALIE